VALAAIAVPAGAIAGWASASARPWWLVASSVCVAAAGVLQLPTHQSAREAPHADRQQQSPEPKYSDKSFVPIAWNIPSPVNTFVNRIVELSTIRSNLRDPDNTKLSAGPASAVVLHGLGGIGKTQLALAYACRYRNDYKLGWWIPAETPATITAALAELAPQLGIREDLPANELTLRIRQALADRQDWMLVFDNAGKPSDLQPFWPDRGIGHVVITSRHHAWRSMATQLSIDPLPLAEAVELLEQRTGQRDQASATTLANALGRLPLALEQAAAYIETQRLSIGRYAELFEQRRGELLARGGAVAHAGTVDATLSLAFEALRQATPAAAQLLVLCALLAPDQIPLDLFLDHPDLLPQPLAEAAPDPLARSETIGALYGASLIIQDMDNTVRIHRLIQDVILYHIPKADLPGSIDRVIKWLAADFPSHPEQPSEWPRCALLLPHAQVVLSHAQRLLHTSQATATLLHVTSVYLLVRLAHLAESRDAAEQALAMRRRLYEEADDPEVATSLSHLGVVVHVMGEFREARALYEQALAMYRRLYGENEAHPDVAANLNNLGRVLRNLGDLPGARDYFEQALAMYRRLHGANTPHPGTAKSLNCLGVVLHGLGDVPAARTHLQEALVMRRHLYGEENDHPDLAESLTDLGVALQGLGDVSGARTHHQRALAMRRSLYGEDSDHPEIARCENNLGIALHAAHDLDGARQCHEQALAMRRRLYGQESDHADIGQSLNNLGAVLHAEWDLEGARHFHEQALAMRRRLYGVNADHPNIAQSLVNLGLVLKDLGDQAGAEVCFKRAEEICEQLGQRARRNELQLSSPSAALPLPTPTRPQGIL
jgi:tetratricopeptide (TPR) repeat protein